MEVTTMSKTDYTLLRNILLQRVPAFRGKAVVIRERKAAFFLKGRAFTRGQLKEVDLICRSLCLTYSLHALKHRVIIKISEI